MQGRLAVRIVAAVAQSSALATSRGGARAVLADNMTIALSLCAGLQHAHTDSPTSQALVHLIIVQVDLGDVALLAPLSLLLVDNLYKRECQQQII